MSAPTTILPVREGEPETHQEQPDALEALRVLLVEDEPLYASLINHKLKQASNLDSRVVTVGNLSDALTHLSAGTTDVVLLDLMLPDSSGISTLSAVRGAAPNVPVVVLTGHHASEWAIDALKLGAEDYLTKGADEDLLVRSIRYSVERSRTRHALAKSEAIVRSTRSRLMQIEKMDSIGRLGAGIAHEVRNPLAILQMGVDYIRKYSGEQCPEVMDTLMDMDEAVTRSFDIINGLLDFCVPTDLILESVSLNSCVCQIMPMVQHEIRNKGIEFRPELAGDLPLLKLDRNKVKQALLHMLINALDAMPDGGELVISTYACPIHEVSIPSFRSLSAEVPEDAQAVVVEILDSGAGIPERVLATMYEPFFTTKAVEKATGLGLCITRNLIELHGGKLDIGNREPRGARASVLFIA